MLECLQNIIFHILEISVNYSRNFINFTTKRENKSHKSFPNRKLLYREEHPMIISSIISFGQLVERFRPSLYQFTLILFYDNIINSHPHLSIPKCNSTIMLNKSPDYFGTTCPFPHYQGSCFNCK